MRGRAKRNRPLNKQALELTQRSQFALLFGHLDPRSRYQRCHIGKDIAQRGIKYETINGSLEVTTEEKAGHNEK